MRKKFLAIYALVGALVASPIFTSCIDSEESASVTAVRTAKAEQLKAAAALDAAKKAIEELNLAHQEKLNAIDFESAQLDLDKKKAEVAKQKAEYEKDMYSYQLLALQNKAALDKYGDQVLSELTNDYVNALLDAAHWNKALFEKNSEIITLQNGLVTVQEKILTETERLTNEIAADKATLEYLKTNKTIDKEAINAKLQDLANQIDAAEKELAILDAQYGSISDGTKSTLATVNAKKGLEDLANGLSSIQNPITQSSTWNFTTVDSEGYLILKNSHVEAYKQSSAYKSTEDYAKDIEGMKAELGTDKDTETTKVSETNTNLTLYAQLAFANKALAAAEKVVADAGDAATQDQINEVNTQKLEVAKAKDAINEKLVEIANAQTISNFDSYIAAFSGEDYEAYKAAADAYAANYELIADNSIDGKLESEINSLISTYLEYTATSPVGNGEFVFNYKTNNYVYKKSFNVDNEIATLEKTIADNEAFLADVKNTTENLTGMPSSNLSRYLAQGYYETITVGGNGAYTEAAVESLISLWKEDIAILEVQLAAAQARAEKAKATLDAYIEASDDTTEDSADTETEAGTEEAA